MIAEEAAVGGPFLVIGAVRGLVAEVAPVLQRLEDFGPDAVGLGVSFDDLRGIRDYFVHVRAEPLVPLTPNELAEIRGLGQYGEIRVPNPSFLHAMEWASARSVPVEALDPSEERYAGLFAKHIGYFELVRRTVTERRLTKRAPMADNADDFALQWDNVLSSGRGSRDLALARNLTLIDGAVRLGRGGKRVAIVLDRERFAPALGLLKQRPQTPD